MKTLITKASLCVVFFMSANSAVLCAQERTSKEDKSLNYRTHLITGGLAQATVFATAISGIIIGELGDRKQFATWVHRTLNLNPPLEPGFLTENFKLYFLTRLIPLMACVTAGLYVVYKMPQWTDMHLLNKDIKRTTKQNIITFLNRVIIPYPIGVCTGEYLSHKTREKMIPFETFEAAVMEKMLEEDTEVNRILREQFAKATVVSREFTGAGFFTNFVIPDDVPKIQDPKFNGYGSTNASLNNSAVDYGFVIFMENGVMTCLEGYGCALAWPDNIYTFELFD